MNNFSKERLTFMTIFVIIIFGFCIGKTLDELDQNVSYLQKENERLSSINKSLQVQIDNHCCETNIVIEYREDIEKRLNDAYNAMLCIEPLKSYDKYQYYTAYKKIIEDYEDILDSPETIYDYYSEEEINLMCRVIETETYQCPFEAKVGVACVILNRIENDKFPSTVEEVIKSPNQFVYGRSIISEDTRLALLYAFEIEDVTNGSIGFRSDICPNYWNGWEYSGYSDGKHFYYKIKSKEVEE